MHPWHTETLRNKIVTCEKSFGLIMSSISTLHVLHQTGEFDSGCEHMYSWHKGWMDDGPSSLQGGFTPSSQFWIPPFWSLTWAAHWLHGPHTEGSEGRPRFSTWEHLQRLEPAPGAALTPGWRVQATKTREVFYTWVDLPYAPYPWWLLIKRVVLLHLPLMIIKTHIAVVDFPYTWWL